VLVDDGGRAISVKASVARRDRRAFKFVRAGKGAGSLEDSWSRLSASNAGYRAAVADGDIHVVQDGDDWTVAVEGALFRYPTRKEAVEAGGRVAAAAHSKLILVGALVSLQGGPSRRSRAERD